MFKSSTENDWYRVEFLMDNNLHRLDGPAVERVDGTKGWFVNDKLHRLNGPAVEWANGYNEWWIDG